MNSYKEFYFCSSNLNQFSLSYFSSRGKNVNEVCDILGRMTGTLTMLVVPVPVPGADSTLRAKAPILHLKVRPLACIEFSEGGALITVTVLFPGRGGNKVPGSVSF